MTISAINTAATKEYVSELDTDRDGEGNPTDQATVFSLGALDSYIKSYVHSKATSMNVKDGVDVSSLKGKPENEILEHMKIEIDAHGMAIQTCRFCVKGWRNFKGVDGKDIPFKTSKTNIGNKTYDVVDPDLIGQLPIEIILELFTEIEDLSTISEDESKN